MREDLIGDIRIYRLPPTLELLIILLNVSGDGESSGLPLPVSIFSEGELCYQRLLSFPYSYKVEGIR